MRFMTYVLIGVVLISTAGCGSDDTKVSVTIPPELCVGFEPSAPPAAGAVTTRLRADSDCDVAVVEVVGTDIAGVFAVATHVVYDPDAVVFVALETTGSALAKDGAELLVRVEELVLGELTIGVARNASRPVDLVGTEVLMALVFVPIDLGDGAMTVETPCLTDAAEPPVPLGGVSCSGGSFTVVEQ